MYISALRIRNFRNFENAEFVFKKGVNTILGENGAGKTNALFALRLLLDSNLPRNVIKLQDTDFCRNLQNWKGHWIIISIDFKELASSEGCQTLKHFTGHMDQSDTGTLNYFFRPNLRIRQNLHAANRDSEKINQIRRDITLDDYEVIFTGRSKANFLNKKEYKSLVGDFTRGIFPKPDEKNKKAYGIKISPLHEEISFTFVKALRDVVTDLKNYRNSPLLQLLKGLEADISEEEAQNIVESVKSLNNSISDLDEIKEVSNGIQNTLHSTVGHTFSPIINIESSLPSELNKLLQKLSLTVGDNYVDGFSGDLKELSLGGANLIYLALKLLEYERKQESDSVAQVLVIEEPEAHIHNHIQKTLFENHAVGKTQVFLSTHSTHISSASNISDMNILALADSVVDVYQPAKGLEPIECSRIERYLNATRSTLLFAKGVILVEGDAELVLIPNLVKTVFGISLDELGISLVSMDSAFFDNISKLFHEDRIRKNCSIITDSDMSITKLKNDPNLDNEFEKACRASQESGILRKQKLDEYSAENDYISVFYADHTFEVDFVNAANTHEVVGILPSIYSLQKHITKSTELLGSDCIAKSGREVLRLAKKIGKGWFSLLLTEELTSQTLIPKYIIDAVAFACQNKLDDSVLLKMCDYRIRNPMLHVMDDDKPFKKFSSWANKSECIDEFIEHYQDDDLTYFINCLDR